MDEASKLSELAKRIKGSVCLECNQHRDFHQTPEQYYLNGPYENEEFEQVDFSKDVWYLRIYPDTPIGFYHKFSNDLSELLDWALDLTKG